MKRFAKILLFSLLGFAAAVLALTLYLRIKYPAERLKELLISTLANDYGLTVSIERLHFNLFSGFEMEGITIPEVKAGGIALARERAPLTIDKIAFAYRFSSLFKRKLEIDEIAINNPIISYWQAPDSTTNLDAIIRAFSEASAAEPDTAITRLPIDINLSSLRLTGILIKAGIASDTMMQQLAAGPLDLAIHSARFDRWNNLSAEIDLLGRNTAIAYSLHPENSSRNFDFAAEMQTQIHCRVVNQDSLALRGEMTLAPKSIRWQNRPDFSLPPINLRTEAGVNLALMRLNMPTLRLAFAGEEQLAARINISQNEKLATFDVRVDRGQIDLDQFMQIIQPREGLWLIPALADIALSGHLEFSGSEFRGNLENMSYSLALVCKDLSYRDAETGFSFEQGRVRLNYATASDTNETILSTQLGLASCSLPLDSTRLLAVGPLDLQVEAALAADYLPRHGQFAFEIQNFSDGIIRGQGRIQSNTTKTNSKVTPANVAVHAALQAVSIELSPFTADSLRGKISGELLLTGKNLNEIACTLNLNNAPLNYLTIDDEGDIPPYHLKTTAAIALHPDLTKIKITDGNIQTEPGSLRFNGEYDLSASAYRFEFFDGMISLDEIVGMLPHHLLGDSLSPAPRIAGRAAFKGWLAGKTIMPDSSNYNGEFFVESGQAVYEDSVLGLYLDDLQISSRWSITPAATQGEFTAKSRAPKMPDYLREPLPQTIASGSIIIGEDYFALTKGRFEMQRWGVTGAYISRGSFLANGLQVKTDLDLDMNAPTAISPNAGLSLLGSIKATFEIDQFLPDDPFARQPAAVKGTLQARDLDIAVDTLMTIKHLNADLKYEQHYEAQLIGKETQIVLKSHLTEETPALANAGELLLLEDIFRKAPRAAPANGVPSQLSIARLEVMGYQLDDIEADLRLGNSRLDIPQVRMKFLDGNMLGNVLVGLGGGSPDQLSYSTAMQISSIDISRLQPLAKRFDKGSRMSADFYLNGRGFTSEQLISDLTGKLNITKMEKKVASNLLQALDPKGTDRGIQNMRLLLKAKWNVRSMSFEIKNGFIYAALEPIKPWFSPFTLPSPIDFARLPLRYFLQTPATK